MVYSDSSDPYAEAEMHLIRTVNLPNIQELQDAKKGLTVVSRNKGRSTDNLSEFHLSNWDNGIVLTLISGPEPKFVLRESDFVTLKQYLYKSKEFRSLGIDNVLVKNALQFDDKYWFPLLQWAARDLRAECILRGNPVLLWLAFHHLTNEPRQSIEMMHSLIANNQRTILKKIHGHEKCSHLSLLRKITLDAGGSDDYHQLMRLLNRQDLVGRLRKFQKVDISLVPYIEKCPALTNYCIFTQGLNPLICEADLLESFEEISKPSYIQSNKNWMVQGIVNLISITQVLAKKYREYPSNALTHLLSLKSVADILSFYDELVVLTGVIPASSRKRLLRKKVLYERGRPFSFPPPLLGNKNIVPILTDDDFVAEGELMSCKLESYNSRIEKGLCYPYRVFGSDRWTLVLSLRDNCVEIIEFLGCLGSRPKPDGHRLVRDWLQGHGIETMHVVHYDQLDI